MERTSPILDIFESITASIYLSYSQLLAYQAVFDFKPWELIDFLSEQFFFSYFWNMSMDPKSPVWLKTCPKLS